MNVIAFYLPQYHPIPENDQWWGKGFTEWTNVGKAKKIFPNHYQPRVPADLGYYDLRVIDNLKAQVELAKEAGVDTFCYWHYWFGEGRRLLENPLQELLNHPEIDINICLGWANESWKNKMWKIDDSSEDMMLMEQKYTEDDDIVNHFNCVLKAFKDPRYLKIDNKPIFLIYRPLDIPSNYSLMEKWNKLALDNGFDGIYFVAQVLSSNQIDLVKDNYNAINIQRVAAYKFVNKVKYKIPFRLFLYKFFNFPLVLDYSFISKYFVGEEELIENVFPTIIPNWDHSPRSGRRSYLFHNSTPDLFKKHVLKVLDVLKNKQEKNKVVFLKSWNEWGEGNYMEPDLKFGKGYIKALREAIEISINK